MTAGSYYDVDVSSAVQGNGPVSFALTSTSATATRYGSREGTHPPLLVVTAPPAPASFAVTRDGATYRAEDAAAGVSHTGSLKSVVESAVADMTGRAGTVTFAAGEFDLGADSPRFIEVADVTFAGQGIDATVIRNSSDENRDTEPFLFRGAEGVVIRDLTVSAGGSPRATSDAIDLGAVMGGLIDRVKIASSRSRGIVTDGKDAIGSAEAILIRDCVVEGVPGDGIELLATRESTVQGCTVRNVGGQGIQLSTSSAFAAQPNKSDDNELSANTVEEAGQNGVQIIGGNRNVVVGNAISNSSDGAVGRDGIRITATGSLVCDDNEVRDNVARDTQDVKTQDHGVAILSAQCHRTVVTGNDLRGNRLGPIRDLGTDTVYGPGDTEPPATPGQVVANVRGPFEIRVSWDSVPDAVAYTVYRDGAVIGTTGQSEYVYVDPAVSPGTTYEYGVDAVDAAGNHSAPGLVVATTGDLGRTFAIEADPDAYVRSTYPDAAYGSSPRLRADAEPDTRSYLRFKVPDTGTSILGATLRLYARSSSSHGHDVRTVTDGTWDEATVTYANAPAVGEVIGSSGPITGSDYVDVDVSPLVTGSGAYTLAVTTPGSTALAYSSRESSAPPELVLETGPAAPPPPTGVLFSDGFESGDLVAWETNRGVVAGQDVVRSGSWAARATGSATQSYATGRIAAVHDVTFTLWFNALAQDGGSLYLMRTRSATNDPVAGVYLTSSGRLATRNEYSAGEGSKTSSTSVGPGWHELKVHVVTGEPADSRLEVWLDGAKVVTRTDTLRPDPLGIVEIGHRGVGAFDVAFDDVEVTTP